MPAHRDIPIGTKFGYWVTIGVRGKTHVMCKCRCDSEASVNVKNLRSGLSTQCKKCHNDSQERSKYHPKLRAVWNDIMTRCYNQKSKSFINYGGRGISACNEWLVKEQFCEWAVQNGWEDGLTIERADNNGNYCPENCKFITRKEQAFNRRTNRLISAFGETKTITEWSEDKRCAVCIQTLNARINKKWDYEFALTTPPIHQSNRDRISIPITD